MNFPHLNLLLISYAFLPFAFVFPVSAVKGCIVLLQNRSSAFKIAVCNSLSANLTHIPSDLPSNVIKLEMVHQPLAFLSGNQFQHIYQLEYLAIESCQLSIIVEDAFQNLQLLRILLLINNSLEIHTNSNLNSKIFRPLINLYVLDLSFNYIRTVPANFFQYLAATLQHLVLSNSKASITITQESFEHLTNLRSLDLSSNNLRSLDKSFEPLFNRMMYLTSLILHNNPWRCDCHLKWLVLWYQHSTLMEYNQLQNIPYSRNIFIPATCHSPLSMRNIQLLRNIASPIQHFEFPCQPVCLTPNKTMVLLPGSNVSLSCTFKIFGSHMTIKWSINNSRIASDNILNTIAQNKMKTHSILTISNFSQSQVGIYKCFMIFDSSLIYAEYILKLSTDSNTRTTSLQNNLQFSSTISTTKLLVYSLVSSLILMFLLIVTLSLVYHYFWPFYKSEYTDVIFNNGGTNNCKLSLHTFNNNQTHCRMSPIKPIIDLCSPFKERCTIFHNNDHTFCPPDNLIDHDHDGLSYNEIDSKVVINPYIGSQATLVTRTPSSTPCPIHCDNLSLSNSPSTCPLHGQLINSMISLSN